MKRIKTVFVLIFLSVALVGCSKEISYDAYEELIASLKNIGYTIEEEDAENDFLAGERKWLTINDDENISVYLYESSDAMEKDASYISDGGTSYDNGKEAVMIDWASYPHFYKDENMIVLYVGVDSEIIQALEELLGPQFAGYME